MRITYWIAALAVLLTGTSVMAIEEPAFTELQKKAEYELRRYAPYLSLIHI